MTKLKNTNRAKIRPEIVQAQCYLVKDISRNNAIFMFEMIFENTNTKR